MKCKFTFESCLLQFNYTLFLLNSLYEEVSSPLDYHDWNQFR